MAKLFSITLAFLLLAACNQDKKNVISNETVDTFFSVDSLPKPNALNGKASLEVKDWEAFNRLETAFESLYKVANREDLKLVIEDLIEKQKLVAGSPYPEKFDVPQVKSRQKVFETFILKTKGDLEYRVNTKEATIEMIHAYNAFRNQFNVMVNSAMDSTLIFDE
ncbi:hypothetical protein SAMN04487911_13216 [Arenibacter nanhaiticus]|uniref:Uncharacterized protein n=1 Tax=Arenibacter nanhaiticus TaxID=558155 RepID=A0A1M6LKN0_9FLAO|nr:hypothetical protein [Arenibacter nanhaiticus]SHJ71730.1 hypothetical protein SAMN04487911_13216 [Arenibacter nanhaiticus]